MTGGSDVRVWDARTGAELLRQKLDVGYGGLDVSPDGRTIAVANNKVRLWDWEAGGEPRLLAVPPTTRPTWARFSPDGKTLYVSDQNLRVNGIDVATGKPAVQFATSGYVYGLRFSPDGRQYVVDSIDSVYAKRSGCVLRETATGKESIRLASGDSEPSRGSWSADGSQFVAAGDRVWVWDLKTGKALGPPPMGHVGTIGAMAFNSDGRLFTASWDHTVRAWNPKTGAELLKLEMKAWVPGLGISRDGSLVAGNALGNDLRVWDARSGKEVFKLLGHGRTGGFRRVWFSQDDDRMITFGDDFYLRTWDTLTGKLKVEHRIAAEGPRIAGFGDDDDQNLTYASREADLTPDGRILLQAGTKDVRGIDVDTGKERFRFESGHIYVDRLTVSPDGKRLAALGRVPVPPPKGGKAIEQANNYYVSVWEFDGLKRIAQTRIPEGGPGGLMTISLAFSPDGKQVAVGAFETRIMFVNASTGSVRGHLDLPSRPFSMAFDGPGKQLAVAFHDGTALIYDLATAIRPVKE